MASVEVGMIAEPRRQPTCRSASEPVGLRLGVVARYCFGAGGVALVPAATGVPTIRTALSTIG
jgi:hypothetical protein